MTKQTAANNQTLRAIKRMFNEKIYKRALDLMNTLGEDATLHFVQQYTTRNIREVLAK